MNFHDLCSLTEKLHNIFVSEFSIDKLYVYGGSARSILDYYFFNKALNMRDIDLCVKINESCFNKNEENIVKILGDILREKFNFSHSWLRPKFRVLPYDLKPTIIGYGIFFKDNQNNIFDIAIYNKNFDLKLNGIFDIEAISIPILSNVGLGSFLNAVNKFDFDHLISNKFVLDPYGGYKNWLNKDAKIINWSDIYGNPFIASIRIVRTYAKLNYLQMPLNLVSILKKLVRSQKNHSPDLQRYIEKIKFDPNPEWSYTQLRKIGILET